MSNLPGIFKINRVNKAMASLAERVVSAINIAKSIPPIKTAILNLQDEEEPQSSVHDNPLPISPEQDSSLKLGAIFPNTFVPLHDKDQERLFMLVVDKGKPSNFYVANIKGVPQSSWNPREIDATDCADEDIKKLAGIIKSSTNMDAQLHFISMVVPKDIKTNSCYYFVAAMSQGSQVVKDRLLLTASGSEFHNCNTYLTSQ